MDEPQVVPQDFPIHVGSVPVVMIFLNVDGGGLVPKWTRTVDDLQTEPKSSAQPSGRMLIESKRVDLKSVIDDLVSHGFIPLRLVDIRRFQGIKRRMALVCVQKTHIKEGDSRMPQEEELGVKRLLEDHLWDTRVFRNPGENGGNFILQCGNPRPTRRSEPLAGLTLSDTGEFVLIDNRGRRQEQKDVLTRKLQEI